MAPTGGDSGGERDLAVLLATMEPELVPGEFAYCSIAGSWALPAGLDLDEVVVLVREREGLTLVVERAVADRLGLAYGYVAAMITLRVHSALEAVGLTAAFATRLTERGLSANVVAGFHHDHLFVPHARGPEAVTALRELSAPD